VSPFFVNNVAPSFLLDKAIKDELLEISNLPLNLVFLTSYAKDYLETTKVEKYIQP
jgi:hypothetical protein